MKRLDLFLPGLAGFIAGLFFLCMSADMACTIGTYDLPSPILGFRDATWTNVFCMLLLGLVGCIGGLYLALKSAQPEIDELGD